MIEVYEEFAQELKKMGIAKVNSPKTDLLNMITEPVDLDLVDAEEFEGYLLEMCNYSTYLKTIKGSIEAQIILIEQNNRGQDISMLRAKLAKVKDLPYAIDRKIRLLETKYKRRFGI